MLKNIRAKVHIAFFFFFFFQEISHTSSRLTASHPKLLRCIPTIFAHTKIIQIT